jgi:RND family efflux transporter MFP subunit
MDRIFGTIAVAIAVFFVSADTGHTQGMPPTPVETEPVRSMQFHNQITLVGRTEARAQSRIVSEVAGRVMRIDAPEGNAVRKGTILVTIAPRSMQYALDAKRAEVEQALAQADLAQKDFERSSNLFDQGLISDGEFDADRAAATRASELYQQRLAERKQLELDLENSRIRAPYDGYTVRKLIDVGEWVNPGTPVYEMVDLGTVKVIVDLPEKHFGKVALESDVLITVSGSGDEAKTTRGKVTGIAPNANRETHTFPVIAAVDNREGLLGGGMLVRATLSFEDIFTSLSVSKDAIVRQGAQTMVYTVAEGKAVPIPVQASSSNGNRIAVQGQGLQEGMPVVVRGNERIFPGSPVSVAGGSEEPADGSSGEPVGTPPGTGQEDTPSEKGERS